MPLFPNPLVSLSHHLNWWRLVLLLGGLLLSSGPGWAQTTPPAARAGLGVHGAVLGIHGQDTLVVKGDLMLDRAAVIGSGTLSLRSNKPQRLVANHSQVRQLHVANPEGVTLQGDLVIEKILTVDSGVLDASLATLTLEKDAHVLVRSGGQVKRASAVATTERGRTTVTNHSYAMLADSDNKLLTINLIYSKKQFENKRGAGLTDLPQQPSPPPEV